MFANACSGGKLGIENVQYPMRFLHETINPKAQNVEK